MMSNATLAHRDTREVYRRVEEESPPPLERRHRATERAAAVLETFATAAARRPEVVYILPDDYDWRGPTVFCPPWRTRAPDNTVNDDWYHPKVIGGHVTYLPGDCTEAAYIAAQREYALGRAAGGLWDHDEEQAMQRRHDEQRRTHVPTPQPEPPHPLYDASILRRYVEAHSADIPQRELECYMLLVVKRHTRREACAELGIGTASLREHMERLRVRAKVSANSTHG